MILFQLLLFGAIVVIVLYGLRQRTALVRRGTRVRGEIVALRFINLTRRRPVVRFPGPDGQLLTLPAPDWVNYGEYHQGQQVDVSYPPNDPARFIIVSDLDHLLEAPTPRKPRRLAKGQERR